MHQSINRSLLYGIWLLTALGLILLAGCSARRSEPIHGKLNETSKEIEHGKLVFMQNCERCHPGGEAGLGPGLNDKPAPGIAMRFQIRHGLGVMPAFKKNEISKDDMSDLIRYLYALRKNKDEGEKN